MFYLASQSPRRRALLESVGLNFEVIRVRVDEDLFEHESPKAAVERLAVDKAAEGSAVIERENRPPHPVLAADTIVVLEDRILGKPGDAAEAMRTLEDLSGRTHRVLTSVALQSGDDLRLRTSESRVTMKVLDRWEIERYWATGEPRDKAGSYAIQGLGSGLVARLEGSYSGVVGLPMFETRELLATVGIDWL
ncbi:MAG TPA: Maf family protein [Arenicellales bacterium]|nr:Maf family protein [Arenicellales bacterium]